MWLKVSELSVTESYYHFNSICMLHKRQNLIYKIHKYAHHLCCQLSIVQPLQLYSLSIVQQLQSTHRCKKDNGTQTSAQVTVSRWSAKEITQCAIISNFPNHELLLGVRKLVVAMIRTYHTTYFAGYIFVSIHISCLQCLWMCFSAKMQVQSAELMMCPLTVHHRYLQGPASLACQTFLLISSECVQLYYIPILLSSPTG